MLKLSKFYIKIKLLETNFGIGRVHDSVDDSGLQVEKNGSGDVVLIVSLCGKTFSLA